MSSPQIVQFQHFWPFKQLDDSPGRLGWQLTGSLTSINLSRNYLDEEAAKALGPAIAVCPSLTAADLSYNNLSVMAKLRLRKAVFWRRRFNLEL